MFMNLNISLVGLARVPLEWPRMTFACRIFRNVPGAGLDEIGHLDLLRVVLLWFRMCSLLFLLAHLFYLALLSGNSRNVFGWFSPK